MARPGDYPNSGERGTRCTPGSRPICNRRIRSRIRNANVKKHAAKEGWGTEVRCYEDAALSGVGADRAGFQRLMADAANPNRDFDVLLVDDSSCLSRSLPDVLHQRLAHYGGSVISISQGIDTRREKSDILIAVHGITDSLYVKELAKKTRRGLEGKFLKGLSAGGRCYGYDIVREEAGSRWVINEA